MSPPQMANNYVHFQTWLTLCNVTFHTSHITAPFREVLKQKVSTGIPTNATFQNLKTLISKAHSTPLQCYQGDLPITGQADARQHGLGTCYLQHSKPIAFTSKSLMDADTQYVNIKWKLLAVVCTYEHFHSYLCDNPFTVEFTTSPWRQLP